MARNTGQQGQRRSGHCCSKIFAAKWGPLPYHYVNLTIDKGQGNGERTAASRGEQERGRNKGAMMKTRSG